MTMRLLKRRAVLSDTLAIEDADELLAWFKDKDRTELDMSALEHIHSAPLQVLMAAQPKVIAWPERLGLSQWLQTCLGNAALKEEQ
ncbi:hypothetical protein [Oceanobacter kriegii]|uniref:hypothetical protein n=1 Tax=Oceanobacter kriegii TaxID=64972 RepID=UPI000409B64D|nr:hypothetical protein [Oceanobacter kriegii]